MSKRVGILVGGGDVPGLNSCLKSLVYRLTDEGFEAIGIRKGWEGLIHYDPHDPTTYGDNFIELNKALVRPIDRTFGSFLHSSRIDPRQTPTNIIPQHLRQESAETQDMTDHIKAVFNRLEFQCLITVGDDDMLAYAAFLSREGMPIIAIPKTIHNNIHGTDYTIGFSTGLARGVSFIHELRALAASREQVLVIETFGVGSGLSSLMISFLAGVDRAIIPEVPYDPARLAQFAMRDKARTPGNYAVITVSNHSTIIPEKMTEFMPLLSPHTQQAVESGPGLVSSGLVAAELLAGLTAEETFLQSLTYLLRTGHPDGQDMLGATNFAILASRLVKQNKYGRMVAYQQRYNLTDVDLQLVTQGVNQVDVDRMYNIDKYRPKIDLIWAAQET